MPGKYSLATLSDKFVKYVDRTIGNDKNFEKDFYPENRILNHKLYGRSYKVRGCIKYSKEKYKYELKEKTYEISFVSAQFYLGVKTIQVDYHLAWESKLYPIAEDAFNVLIAESQRLEDLIPKRIEVVQEDKAFDTTERNDIKLILNENDQVYYLEATNFPLDAF
jgi:hypothetical protein